MKSPFNTPSTKAGSDKAISQHKAIASGIELAATPNKVNINQTGSKSGCNYAPGMTGSKSSKRKGK